MADVFGKLGPDSPVSRALRQLVQERAAAAMSEVAGDKLGPTERAHAAGRLEELLGLQAELVALTEKPAAPRKSA
jgi:hypothetical protein